MKDQAMIIGIHPVLEALEAGKQIDRIYFQRDARSEGLNKIRHEAMKAGVHFQFVPIEKLNRLKSGNHQGVIALISEIDFAELDNVVAMAFEQGRDPFVVLLDKVSDVRNFGAVCRTALCAGADAVLIPLQGAARINADAMKASAGALNKIAICRSENLKDSLHTLRQSGLRVIGCTEKAQLPYHKADLKGPLVLIMGSEEDGISGEYLKLCDEKITIPMSGKLDSLNVSVAAGIVMFEVFRQRGL